MASYLEITDSLGNRQQLPLQIDVFTLGRQADNDLRVPEASVSRHHAEIIAEGEDFFLVDQNSKSGTFVNTERIFRHQLRHGDIIRLGNVTDFVIRFFDEPPPAQAADAEAATDYPRRDTGAHAELENLARFLEVNRALKISLSIEELLLLIVDSAVEISRADRGALLLFDDAGSLQFRVARDRNRRSLPSSQFTISQTVIDQALLQKRSVIADDDSWGGLPDSQSVLMQMLRTVVCIPMPRYRLHERIDTTMVDQDIIAGLLYVDSQRASSLLTKSSVTLLESLAFEASKALENVRLMQQEQAKQRLESELAMAREVQLALLTSSKLDFPSFEIAARSLPSRYVDGDFYDLLTLGEGRAALILGDVAGKGISAALLAAMAQGVLYAKLEEGFPIATVMSFLNDLILQKSPDWRFITLFCGVLGPDGCFTFVNAGNNPPILIRAGGETEFLSSGSMVIGALDSAVYAARQVQLSSGDVLLAFTDGVTEAVNSHNEMYGEERLSTFLRSVTAGSAEEILSCVLQEVIAYSKGMPQEDDISIIALKCK